MSAITVLISLCTIGQVIVCGFSLWWVVALICRILFMLRGFGIIFKTRPMLIGECFALGFMLLWYFVFKKDAIPWLTILWNLVFTLLTAFFEWLDGILYVYEVMDEDDYEQ